MKFRKKPVVIEARQLNASVVAQARILTIGRTALEQWCGGTLIVTSPEAFMEIPTLEGLMRAELGDWIIRGVKGDFYPCKPDIFTATYEFVEP